MPVAPILDGNALSSDALQYVGHQYVFGGAPGIDGKGPWDCSSFMNWVLGHDFGLKLPGSLRAGYDGTSHGPVVASYATWGNAVTVPSPQAGDLVLYLPNVHIGMATSPTTFVSALNPGLGTLNGPIKGAAPGAIMYRRVIGISTISNIASGCLPGTALIGMLYVAQASYRANRRSRRTRRFVDSLPSTAKEDGYGFCRRCRGIP